MKKNGIISVGHILFLMLHFSLLGFLLVFSKYTWNDYKYINKWSFVISILALSFLIIHLLSIAAKKVHYTDFRLWFIVLSYLFMFGRVFLKAFNLDTGIFWDLSRSFSVRIMYQSGLFILSCIQGIFIGFFILHREEPKNFSLQELSKLPQEKPMFIAGLVLFFSTLPIRLFYDIRNILSAQSAGSYSVLSNGTGLIDDIAFFTLPAIIFILASGKLSRKASNIIFASTILYFILNMVLTGDRRYPTTAILAIVLFYLRIRGTKITLKGVVIWLIFGSFLLNILSILKDIRTSGLMSAGKFISNFGTSILFNTSTLYDVLSEFGLTFYSVTNIVKFTPLIIPYQMGLTFLRTIPSVIPIGWMFGDFFSQASMSGIINTLNNLPVGATLFGDLYVNFGLFGIGTTVIIGMCISKLFSFKGNPTRFTIARYFSLFYILINLIRASVFEVFRSSVWIYILPILLVSLFNRKNKDN